MQNEQGTGYRDLGPLFYFYHPMTTDDTLTSEPWLTFLLKGSKNLTHLASVEDLFWGIQQNCEWESTL